MNRTGQAYLGSLMMLATIVMVLIVVGHAVYDSITGNNYCQIRGGEYHEEGGGFFSNSKSYCFYPIASGVKKIQIIYIDGKWNEFRRGDDVD